MSLLLPKREIIDRAARYAVSAGGIAVIVAILAIFFFIFREVTPLFTTPTARLLTRFSLSAVPPAHGPVHIGMDDSKTIVYVLSANGVQFVDLSTGTPIPIDGPQGKGRVSARPGRAGEIVEEGRVSARPGRAGEIVEEGRVSAQPGWAGEIVEEGRVSARPGRAGEINIAEARMTAVAQGGVGSIRYMIGTADGRILPVKIGVTTQFSDSGERSRRPLVQFAQPFRISSERIAALAYRAGGTGQGLAAMTTDGTLLYATLPESETDHPIPVREVHRFDQPVTQLALDAALANLYAATADGLIYHVALNDAAESPVPTIYRVAREGVTVSALGFLNGDRSLIVATGDGEVSAWGLTRMPGSLGRFQFERLHVFASHRTPVTAFSPSQRDKGFVTADEAGQIYVHYATSEQTWLKVATAESAIRTVAFAPKSDGYVALDAQGTLTLYEVRNPFPEVTFQTLIGAVWYEGYEAPEHVWQSSSGSDEFEPKYGLVPLAFGTIKGTMYALVLAVPLAILSAAFTSQFMHPDLRGTIKPIIEIMAALPTVVLGFLAGLWLAPLLERFFPAFVAMFIFLPCVVIVMAFLWRGIPLRLRERLRPGMEAVVLVPVLAGSVWLCLQENQWIESLLFGGDFKQWVVESFGVHYDQRNAVVVGIVMGFAIIPIIYSIAEEAMSNVPKHLIAGSLALGATRWQTVLRLVLLAASPGIFSAIMIGFGRAVGETMIVLMATGNTPILDWSWSNGFRTLAANIAVEIPEAPHGGTLYRVLFLAALLLFVLTFAINTVAELVRQRLREKYTPA